MWISTESDPTIQSDALHCGGKGKNLFFLLQQGLRVPPFVVLNPNGNSPKNIDQVTLEWLKESLNFPEFVAVRSSAVEEDGANFSFAGQFTSELFVPWGDIDKAIKKVWDSKSNSQIATYCAEHKIPEPNNLAIIIQAMVESEVSGVAFGINPLTGNRNEVVISSLFGLGEGLVGGELNADTYLVGDGITTQKIAQKSESFVFNTLGAGTQRIPLPSIQQSQSSLNEQQIAEVAKVVQDLGKTLGKAQDIEFAYNGGQLFVLQTRPITGLYRLANPMGERILWDNSNIIESYPGVTTPLTFGFIIQMYESVYVQLCRLLGVSETDLTNNKELFANMLGLLNGRVYYNLLSWYKALALLPGYHLNAEFMEKMMGVKERFELKGLKKRTHWQERWRVLIMIRSMISNLRGLPKMRTTFQKEFEEVMLKYNRIDLNLQRAEELMVLYQEFEQTLLKKWKAPLVNDFFAMIYFGITQKMAVKYGLPEGIHNDLLCGASDIISTEPIHRIKRISTMICNHAEAKELFENKKADEILKSLPQFAEIHAEIKGYIDKFGDRCVGELKLETITYKQDNEAFIQIIQSYVRQGIQETQGPRIDIQMRESAESKVREHLKGKPIKQWLFHYFLKHTRIMVSARENLRFERTRGFGKVREIFVAMGKIFYAEGLIDDPRDIFYLKHTEIFDYIKGTSVTPELSELIAFRKQKYANYVEMATNERIETFGMVYHGNNFAQQKSNDILEGDLMGLGCCPGRVRAKVQVIHNPKEVEDLNGDILVTSSTDPGWVTLFPTASAILVERGSLLSHSAIVSRELGKPCIVGITDLLKRLKTGDWVEMDGSTGVVKIIASEE
jgi:phosphoenolpyruvate synthase/pyruvate phosphate dikinase